MLDYLLTISYFNFIIYDSIFKDQVFLMIDINFYLEFQPTTNFDYFDQPILHFL